ncbi:MAG: penicillin-binding protein 1C [Pelagimonas sp.]|jgi:penicillin-binding protein 1C|nr:penicillin-binding protein 1C [Pelagimonas sp.]
MRHTPLVLVLALWLMGLGADRFRNWVQETQIPPLAYETGAEVRDRNGALLRAYTVDQGRWRLAVDPDKVDPIFVSMLTAYEDKRFFDHPGVDLRALSRAAGQALWNGRVVSGASTLTMQVARLLEDGSTGQWQGKLRQIRLALALEQRLSKADILTLYLHLAPYGGNVEGLRAASLIWLGKEPARLTPAEAALLVALPQAPESRRPDRFPEAAKTARNRVLLRMARDGVIPARAAHTDQLDPAPKGRFSMPLLAPHLADEAVADGSGRVDLTLDLRLQRSLHDLTQRYMADRDPRLSAAVILADHSTGEILASVGSTRYSAGQSQGFVDMTQALRSPGSTLKPLVYGLAFDQGLAHPETLVMDTPVQFGRYAPQNFDGIFRGELPMRRALQLSLNIPVIRLSEALGPAHLMAALSKSGLQPKLPSGAAGLAVSLGGVGITLRDMVQLYAMLANGGETRALRWRKGAAPPEATRVLSPAAAWHLGDILSEIPPPPMSGPPGRVAYKTGTSYGHRDAWALGWNGQYVAGVWIGRPDGTPVPGAFGGDLAAPLLFEALSRASAAPVPLPAPPAETLLMAHAALPQPLKRFGDRQPKEGLQILFPPSGARLTLIENQIALKLRGGSPPYTVLRDGALLATGLYDPHYLAPVAGTGFVQFSVIDAAGQSGQVQIEVQ